MVPNIADLSVIIVNFNTRDFVNICLSSIYARPFVGKLEVIVVDNDSRDGSVEMLRSKFKDVRLILNRRNIGFAAANNQGARIAAGEYFLLLNPDTELLGDALNTLYLFISSHPNVAIVAPLLVDESHSNQASCRKFPTIWQEVVKAVGAPRYLPNHPIFGFSSISDYENDCEIDQPQGACLLVRKDALDSGIVFDEQFYMYYEEVDLCYRIKKRGWGIWFVPGAHVVHFSGKSFSRNMPRMIFHIYRSKFLFFKKHHCFIRQVVIYLLTMYEMVYRCVVYSMMGLLRPERRKECTLRIKGYLRVLIGFSTGRLSES
ncbi:MAG: glycosyltransferase family 2 protein [candidate division WOR-3 bacterium]|nr:MAG: glycosyltransferase family 2 protein [candidate division WOR-3 bacterium]